MSIEGKAAELPIVIEQGATFDFNGPLLLTNTVDGSIRTLAGYTARMQIRKSPGAPATFAEWSTTTGHITINASAGSLTFSVPPAETAALSFNGAVYDLELVSGAGVVERLFEGPATLSREVTR